MQCVHYRLQFGSFHADLGIGDVEGQSNMDHQQGVQVFHSMIPKSGLLTLMEIWERLLSQEELMLIKADTGLLFNYCPKVCNEVLLKR